MLLGERGSHKPIARILLTIFTNFVQENAEKIYILLIQQKDSNGNSDKVCLVLDKKYQSYSVYLVCIIPCYLEKGNCINILAEFTCSCGSKISRVFVGHSQALGQWQAAVATRQQAQVDTIGHTRQWVLGTTRHRRIVGTIYQAPVGNTRHHIKSKSH